MKRKKSKSLLLSFVACLKEELAKENEQKELSTFVFKLQRVNLIKLPTFERSEKNKLHVLKLCNLKSNNRLGKETILIMGRNQRKTLVGRSILTRWIKQSRCS